MWIHVTGQTVACFFSVKMVRIEQGALCFPVSGKYPELKGDTFAVQWMAQCCPCVCKRGARATVQHSKAWYSDSRGSRPPLLGALCLGTALAGAEGAGGAKLVPLQANIATALNCEVSETKTKPDILNFQGITAMYPAEGRTHLPG